MCFQALALTFMLFDTISCLQVFVTDAVVKAALSSAPPPSLPPAARLSVTGLMSRLTRQGGLGGALLGSALLAVCVIAPAVRLGALGYAATLAGEVSFMLDLTAWDHGRCDSDLALCSLLFFYDIIKPSGRGRGIETRTCCTDMVTS